MRERTTKHNAPLTLAPLTLSESVSGAWYKTTPKENEHNITIYARKKSLRGEQSFQGGDTVYPLLEMPIELALVGTHVCVDRSEIEERQLFLSSTMRDREQGLSLSGKPLVFHLRCASQVLRIRSEHLNSDNSLNSCNARPCGLIQSSTITLAH